MPNRNFFKTQEEYLNWYREYRRINRGKIREYNRIYNRDYRKENGYKNELKWIKKHPLEVRAQKLAYYAQKIGILVKKPCEICGDFRSIMHHNDYDKPFEVRWLCPVHHKEHHLKDLSTD